MLWTGATDTRGYGKIGWVDRRKRTVTRVVVELELGRALSPDEDVCHTCDTPACVNPAHLFIGNAAINRADCKAKDRHNRGERNGKAVLTSDDVLEIRRVYRPRDPVFGAVHLARRFGVSRSAVGLIVQGKNWVHLTPPSHDSSELSEA